MVLLFFSVTIVLLQIPGSQEAVDSLVDGIPKTKEGLIDWSQVSQLKCFPFVIACVITLWSFFFYV